MQDGLGMSAIASEILSRLQKVQENPRILQPVDPLVSSKIIKLQSH